MKIRAHTESHIVELDDGSRWQVFPGDLDLTCHSACNIDPLSRGIGVQN